MKAIKKTTVSLLIALLVFGVFSGGMGSLYAQTIDIEAESAILVDAETGQILYAKNADLMLPPASMTKMMTEYLVLEAISEGQIDWDTTTQISDYPYSISANNAFSGIGLIQNKDYTVRELYEGMAIISDNATTIALAELVAGSEGDFVRMMNEKGEALGLTDFEFVNSTGLTNASLGDDYPEGTDPEADNLISARSAATLAYHLVNDYPEVLEFSSTIRSQLDGQPLENLNWMLPWNNDNFSSYFYEGVDGLKTGYTQEAGYCFTGTAERNGQRLITVVMRTESYGARFNETQKLFDYGFNEFSKIDLYEAGYQLDGESTLPVNKGKEDQVDVELAAGLSAMVRHDEEEAYTVEYVYDEDKFNDAGELVAPLDQGETIGQARLVYQGNADYGNIYQDNTGPAVDIITLSEVEQANWFMLTMGAVGDFFSNIFTTVVDTVTGWF
ncbi:D-alanyl-D-alanine carboxypeptidase (penicillin-binding protein 5/6) [Amphibacillus marinus]|uniref:serine-type D-Ala-D-Ala carboxypeptidase n=1 Tax=Amphibacillus marinus TaxID=872970 RepID=A0A1H8PEB1_9BACI|nr:serine hydrolase [Amphibacillus marinus]SEO40097.1 D-alanyl-D-alanine carboxypeptidase (penicillin-binding protein 5/6) [Amphibacillus marinus]